MEMEMEKKRKGNRCVVCGFAMNQLFLQYSPGNIRLLKCENCNSVADEYIECELMIMTDVFLGNVMFLCAFVSSSRIFLRTSAGSHRFEDLFLAIIISSYFKIFLLCMSVWEFPSTVIFIIDLFVLSSNAVAIKVMTESALSRCVGSCLCAHAAKFLGMQLFQFDR